VARSREVDFREMINAVRYRQEIRLFRKQLWVVTHSLKSLFYKVTLVREGRSGASMSSPRSIC